MRAPVLAEGFGEVSAHLAQLPPKPLRPRRLTEDVERPSATRVLRLAALCTWANGRTGAA